jgi:predicted Zn finger-like uncharacterized protein
MRLICPECGAEYEAPDSEIPIEGRHVQCTACHTRWFARKPVAETVSEDEILTRLESRRPHLRPVPDAGLASEEPGDFEWEEEPATEASGTETSGRSPDPASPGFAPFPTTSVVPQPRAVPDPAPATPPRMAAAARTPQTDTHRLDLTAGSMTQAGAAPRERGGFRRGLVIGLGLVLAALALYLLARPVSGAIPLLSNYVDLIDGMRATLAFATQS